MEEPKKDERVHKMYGRRVIKTLLTIPEVRAMPGRCASLGDEGEWRRGLHNITDVIRSIRYPVSATHTI